MNNRLFLIAVIVAVCAADRAGAQQPAGDVQALALVDTTKPAGAVNSSMDRPSGAVRRSDLVPAAPLPASTMSLGAPKAQMIVGGAAFVAGALIGGDVGTVLSVGGAVLGLYGLYNYLK